MSEILHPTDDAVGNFSVEDSHANPEKPDLAGEIANMFEFTTAERERLEKECKKYEQEYKPGDLSEECFAIENVDESLVSLFEQAEKQGKFLVSRGSTARQASFTSMDTEQFAVDDVERETTKSRWWHIWK